MSNKELTVPENLDDDVKSLYIEMMEAIRESSKRVRGAILNERGKTVWEEPLDEYEQRMKSLRDITECIKKKPSPPPRPPMRKYKTSFLGIDVLVNQDDIDEHRATTKKWREENLK